MFFGEIFLKKNGMGIVLDNDKKAGYYLSSSPFNEYWERTDYPETFNSLEDAKKYCKFFFETSAKNLKKEGLIDKAIITILKDDADDAFVEELIFK